MSNIFIIHGVGGTPEENWFPWLKEALEKLGHHVVAPQFPTLEGSAASGLESWLRVLEPYKAQLDSDSILIGHSLGASFILNVLEKGPAKAAFLVAGFVGKIGDPFDEPARTFAQREFDWEGIRRHCQKFYVIHSDNDPYVPLKKAEELATNLGTKVILVKGGGHLNQGAGYTKFERLLEYILGEVG